MKIELKPIKVRDLVKGYVEEPDEVIGYNGLLDIRPKYQREMVYKDAQQVAVINTVSNGLPLNVMYWAKNDNGFEVLDGQQRTISICRYVSGDFAVGYQFFHNLSDDKQNEILDYELLIYQCDGSDDEKLEWFETINIAGEKLTKQELRNAVYSGPWLTDAKVWFSRIGAPAYQIGNKLVKGSPIRQDYLETAIKWISDNNIESYMAAHQHEHNATELWKYYTNVITWVESLFNYRKEMKGVNWGKWYNYYKDTFPLTKEEIEIDVKRLMEDEDVTKKSGIYDWIFTNEEKYLSLRAFTPNQKREAYERQNGICPVLNERFPIEEMEADHKIEWSKGGKTTAENCQMLSKKAHKDKTRNFLNK